MPQSPPTREQSGRGGSAGARARARSTLAWGLTGAGAAVATYVGILLGSLHGAAPDGGFSVPPGRGWQAALAYLVLAAVATPSLFVVGGLLTIARPVRAFALGLVYGASFGGVVVSSLALFLFIPAPTK